MSNEVNNGTNNISINKEERTMNGTAKEWTVNGVTYNTDNAIRTDDLGGDQHGYLFDDGMVIIDGKREFDGIHRKVNESPYANNATSATKVYFTDNVNCIPNGLFFGCSNLRGNLVIPDSVEDIESWAFANCTGLTGNLVIPDSVVTMGIGAFYRCNGFKGTLTLSNSLADVESMTFAGCTGFTGDLTIPHVFTIKKAAFAGCKGFNGTLSLPDMLTTIEKHAFAGCLKLKSKLTIPERMTDIDDFAFYNCRFRHVYLPDQWVTISKCAFTAAETKNKDKKAPVFHILNYV